MDYKIRFATFDDYDLIYALKKENLSSYVENIWGWDEDYQVKDFNKKFNDIQHFFVIEVDGRFAGFLQYYYKHPYFEVENIHLNSEYRGNGIGSEILRNLQKVCIAQDRNIRLSCFKENYRAKSFYQRLSFMLTGETETHYILEYPNYMIIPYNEKYRDDMIFMILEAKNAIGRTPRLNEDLLDIQKNYLDTGDMFWLAIDEDNRVISCIGYNSILDTSEVKLHRFYIKAERKRQGIGTRLLHTVEMYLQERRKTVVHVHLGGKDYFESYNFYLKHGYKEYAPSMMKKELSTLDSEQDESYD